MTGDGADGGAGAGIAGGTDGGTDDGADGGTPPGAVRRRWRPARIVPARQVWLSAGVAALALWALIWYLCTPAVIEWLTGEPFAEVWSGIWTPGYLLAQWTREGPGAVYYLDGDDTAGVVSARVVVLTLLFALAVGWAVRAVPPTARRWPVTLLLCSALAVGCAVTATTLVALVQPFHAEPDFGWGRGELVGSVTGTGAPLLLLFGPVAAALGLAVGALGREPAAPPPPSAQPPGESPAEPSSGPLPRWLSLRAAGVLAAVVALMIGALGYTPFIMWLAYPMEGEPRLSWGLLRWLLPGSWAFDGEGSHLMGGVPWLVTVAAGLVQALLAGALFWPLLRQGLRRTLPALVITGAAASLTAAAVAQVPVVLIALGDTSAAAVVHYALWFTPGAITAGLAGGLAAGLLLRHGQARTAPGDEPGPGGAGRPAVGGWDSGPDDELVITLSR